jgi:hypothetical protein
MKVFSKTLTFVLALCSFVRNTSIEIQHRANGIFVSIAGVSVVISGIIVLSFDNKTIARIGLTFLVLVVFAFCFEFSHNFFAIWVLCILKAFSPFVANAEWAGLSGPMRLGCCFVVVLGGMTFGVLLPLV